MIAAVASGLWLATSALYAAYIETLATRVHADILPAHVRALVYAGRASDACQSPGCRLDQHVNGSSQISVNSGIF